MSALADNPYDLRAAGIKVLMDGLGYDDAQEFLKLWRGTPGRDFNKWLNEQPQESVEDAIAAANRIAAADIASGKYANKVVITGTVGADMVGV